MATEPSIAQRLQTYRQQLRQHKQQQLSLAQTRTWLDEGWRHVSLPADSQFKAIEYAGFHCEIVSVGDCQRDKPLIVLVHGGGYNVGSTLSHRPLAAQLAQCCRTEVLTFNYRLAPEHRFPAAHDDAAALVRQLCKEPRPIVLVGDSGGAALACATALDVAAPQIIGLLLLSPWLDAACSSDSYQRHKALDPSGNRGGLRLMACAYAGVDQLDNPRLSPIYRHDLHRLPNTLIHVGSNETVLDETLQFVQHAHAASRPVQLQVWPDMIHGFHSLYELLPEVSTEAYAAIGHWFKQLPSTE